jgi:hypothetical protein
VDRSLYERERVTFTNPSRFSTISAFTKARAGKNVNFYAYWASRYLTFSKRLKNADPAEALRLFLEDLRSRENIAACHAGHDDSAEKPTGSPLGKITKIRRARRRLKDCGSLQIVLTVLAGFAAEPRNKSRLTNFSILIYHIPHTQQTAVTITPTKQPRR